MCELFAISSAVSVQANELLKVFYSHSNKNPEGWGLAILHDNSVNLEKEPHKALDSEYLKSRLQAKIEVHNMIAHIRKATCGNVAYENCHPFVRSDCDHRVWTVTHNGTIFDSPRLVQYVHQQVGTTDSERVLCYLIDVINTRRAELCRPLTLAERFECLDKIVCKLSVHNKLNLVIYDGEVFYIHTNCKNTLYIRQETNTAYFATVPLDQNDWHSLPFTTLLAFKNGRQIMSGTCHGHEYIENSKNTQYLFNDGL